MEELTKTAPWHEGCMSQIRAHTVSARLVCLGPKGHMRGMRMPNSIMGASVACPMSDTLAGISKAITPMPRFDFYCHHCSKKWTDVWVSSIRDAQSAPRACSVCGADMEKLPAAPNFVLKGYNAANGYSTKPKS